ncbi:neutral zinc metallopeptidase [Propionibacteriaceae bacterium Y1685]|uniref:neutral zinc metallopeptidase n=1 Tax=Microlunatus sp. Y1700 TaxID=3418487 RepID=UPI003B82B817
MSDPFSDGPSVPGQPDSHAADPGHRADEALADRTERPRPPRRRTGALLGGALALVLIGVAGAVLIMPRLTDRTASAPPPPATSTTPTPTPSPTPTDFTAFLINHPFNDEKLGEWSCEVAVEPPDDDEDLDAWIGSIVDCLDERFAGPIEQAGHRPGTPRRKFFSGKADTPCGDTKAAAFYCPSDETINLDADEIGTYVDTMRLGAFHVIFHEYAHHVQQRLGIMRASNDFGPDRGDRRASVRRLELQADCLYVSSLSRLRQVDWSEADAEELAHWRVDAGDDTHGRTASQQHWLEKGIESGAMSACNTWNADSEDVA